MCGWYERIVPWCVPFIDDYYQCALSQPASSIECDSSPRLVSGTACEEKNHERSACLDAGPPEGLPDMTADCQAYCAIGDALSCSPPDCVQACLDRIEFASRCRGAWAALTHCLAQEPASDFSCDETWPRLTNMRCRVAEVLIQFCHSSP
ncbi:hypothetical protein [Chondromyces crocatus]|nr:hypothetical protein [Chondromyces crocatus]